MTEQTIQQFWHRHPCGESQVGGLKLPQPAGNGLIEDPAGDYEAFFKRYDAFRYSRESHIPKRLDAIDFEGKRVLEIGLGQGADSEQIIRRGAVWSGVDMTGESIRRVSTRLRLRGLPYQRIECASALAMPFPADSFDIVFSHGVLHHIPDVTAAQKEIARVLRPQGRLIAMLYARRSLNYLVAISVVRRLAIAALYLSGLTAGGIVGSHLANAKRLGLGEYLKMSTFLHANTDGPLNPYSKVYDLCTVNRDFPDFEIEKSYQDHMHAPPLPTGWLRPLSGVLGWHLWVHLIPRKA
jgi:SAM-dependent methyltransferase